jgi:hypothetical protein
MNKVFLFFCFLLLCLGSFAQVPIDDEAFRYQEQRMVFQQWDQNKFKPGKGFLGLNPYYWLVWGWPYPNYHKTDLRPLSATGPQTQRLALVAAMNSTDNSYKLQSDTVRRTALAEITNQSGQFTGADPLWLLYYRDEFKPVLNNSMASILSGLSPAVSAKLVSEGLYAWYKNELDRLKERIDGAHSADMDRGSRILAYHRLLLEYRGIAGVWAVRCASAASVIAMTASEQKLKSGAVAITNWTPQSDIRIANKILQHVQ